MGGWEHWFSGCWWIFLIFVFTMIVACMLVMRRCSCMSGRDHPGGRQWRFPAESAGEILNRRYALGEIGRGEYEEKKAAIGREEERSDRQGS